MEVDGLEVLKVVLEYVCDAATLLACSMLSTTCQSMTQQAVQGRSDRLAELVTASSFSAFPSRNCAIRWLCEVVGPAAVNSYPAGCAVLDKVMQTPREVAPLMLATGLRLTNELLVYMAKQGMCNMPVVVRNIIDNDVPSSADDIYVSAASGDIVDTMQETVCLAITADNIVDLLTIRSQVCVWDDDAVPAMLAMLMVDESRLHVLHFDSASASASAKAAATGRVSSNSNSLQTSEDAVRLVVQLLPRAYYGPYAQALFDRLLTLPAVRQLGAMDTFKVLQQAVAAACNQHSAVLAPSLEIFEKLAGLAGAAEIPAVWAAELIAHCIASQQYGYAKVLLKMPIAEQMNCQQLCKLAGMVRRGGGHEFGLYHSIESVLERLAERRQMHRAELQRICDAAEEIFFEDFVWRMLQRLRLLG